MSLHRFSVRAPGAFIILFVRIAAVTAPHFPALEIISMNSNTLAVLRFVTSLVELQVKLTTYTR